jgi:3-methyladenine DNA glycosylase AlkD
MYEEMIVSGAWWDFVDPIAKDRLGPLLDKYPEIMREKMLEWAEDAHLWKRRSAILCQLGFKKNTDISFLHACMEPSFASKEFFLQKAIGWALRQYAWSNTRAVQKYVKQHGSKLSALSVREALKNIA